MNQIKRADDRNIDHYVNHLQRTAQSDEAGNEGTEPSSLWSNYDFSRNSRDPNTTRGQHNLQGERIQDLPREAILCDRCQSPMGLETSMSGYGQVAVCHKCGRYRELDDIRREAGYSTADCLCPRCNARMEYAQKGNRYHYDDNELICPQCKLKLRESDLNRIFMERLKIHGGEKDYRRQITKMPWPTLKPPTQASVKWHERAGARRVAGLYVTGLPVITDNSINLSSTYGKSTRTAWRSPHDDPEPDFSPENEAFQQTLDNGMTCPKCKDEMIADMKSPYHWKWVCESCGNEMDGEKQAGRNDWMSEYDPTEAMQGTFAARQKAGKIVSAPAKPSRFKAEANVSGKVARFAQLNDTLFAPQGIGDDSDRYADDLDRIDERGEICPDCEGKMRSSADGNHWTCSECGRTKVRDHSSELWDSLQRDHFPILD